MSPAELEPQLLAKLKERPWFFSELLEEYPAVAYRTFLLAWSEVRTHHSLSRDDSGRYYL